MNKLFINKTAYTEETYMDFVMFHNKTYNLSYLLYTLFWTILLALCSYLLFSTHNPLQGTVFILIIIAFLYYRIYRPKLTVRKELKSEKVSSNNTNTFIIYDKIFRIKNSNGSFDFRYFNLHRIFETQHYFYLYVDRENAFILSKEGFTLGTAKAFSKFIKNKCKLKYRYKRA